MTLNERDSHLLTILRSTLESQKDAIIFSIDTDYKYLYFNQTHYDSMKFAYDMDIETGKAMLDYVTSEDDRKLLEENFESALKGEPSSYIQTFGDVHQAYYEVFINPIVDEKGEIIGCTCLAKNITDRVKTEKLLKESETKFREIIDQIYDGILVFDEKGKIIIWNRGAEHLTGLYKRDVLNRNIVDIQYQLIPPQVRDREQIENAIKGITTRTTPERFNHIIDSELIVHNTDILRNIQSVIFPIILNGYNLFCTVIRDNTEIKRYEKELLKISSDKDKFYSIIAQYLYTPFNVFNNFSKLMAEELDNLPLREIQKMAAMMSKSASNMYNMLDNLLQWTRMNQGKIPFEPQHLDLKKLSKEAISVFEPVNGSKNFNINQNVEDGIIVYADSYMLKTILRNIVACLIKFSDDDCQIDIQAEQISSSMVVSILSKEVTLKQDFLSKLFDYSQVHSVIGAAEEKGSALSLLLCREFVEKHSGKIWVESKNLAGTEIKFTLPHTV